MISAGFREKRVRSSETYSVALHTFLKDDRPCNASLLELQDVASLGSEISGRVASGELGVDRVDRWAALCSVRPDGG